MTIDLYWRSYLEAHPECAEHKPYEHDSLLDPHGCGHCRDCHDPRPYGPSCGHSAGCPGC